MFTSWNRQKKRRRQTSRKKERRARWGLYVELSVTKQQQKHFPIISVPCGWSLGWRGRHGPSTCVYIGGAGGAAAKRIGIGGKKRKKERKENERRRRNDREWITRLVPIRLTVVFIRSHVSLLPRFLSPSSSPYIPPSIFMYTIRRLWSLFVSRRLSIGNQFESATFRCYVIIFFFSPKIKKRKRRVPGRDVEGGVRAKGKWENIYIYIYVVCVYRMEAGNPMHKHASTQIYTYVCRGS